MKAIYNDVVYVVTNMTAQPFPTRKDVQRVTLKDQVTEQEFIVPKHKVTFLGDDNE